MHLEYFQMVDRIVSVDRDCTRLVVQSTVPNDSTVFEGHFPGMPLVPGVLLIETMAQTSGFLVLARTGFTAMPLLAGVKQAKMRDMVGPDRVLDVTAELEHDGSGFAMTKTSISADGKKVCDAQLTLKTIPFPDEDFAAMIAERAAQLDMPQEFFPKS